MKSPVLLLSLLLAALPALAHDTAGHGHTVHDRTFQRASELVGWCRQEAEAHFVGQGIPTYQWTASYQDRGNQLIVEGRLRADGRDVPVTCRVARGAREHQATVDIGD